MTDAVDIKATIAQRMVQEEVKKATKSERLALIEHLVTICLKDRHGIVSMVFLVSSGHLFRT